MGKKVDQSVKETEAKTLKAMFEAAGNPNYDRFARTNGIVGGKAVISQHINCVRPISMEAGIGYAIGFKKPLADISPRLAAIIDRLPRTHGDNRDIRAAEQAMPAYGSLTAELLQIAEKMDDRGLILVIDKAEEIALRHPRKKKEAA